MNGTKLEHGRMRADAAARPVEDRGLARSSLDLKQFLAPVQSREAGLVFAIWPTMLCQPTPRKPVSNPKGF